MCDYEEPSERPPEFEMEERLDDTEDSQLATSVESEGGEAWGEGDSQPGEVEALEPEMDDSQEWAEEQTQHEGEEAEEVVKEEWTEEPGAQADEPGLEIEEHLDETEETANETEEQREEVDEQGREAEERGEEMEEQSLEEQSQEERSREMDESGEVNEEHCVKMEEHSREDVGHDPDEEVKSKAEPDDNASQEGSSAEQDSIYESLAGDREEALMQDDAPAAAAAEALKGEGQEGQEEAAEEVEWLMEEALSEDEGEQAQMEMEATLNSFERDPSDVRPPAGSAGRRDTAARIEDDGDNNSTEDLLRLLGDESDKTQAELKTESAAAGDNRKSDEEEDDDMSWKLNYINEAKEKLIHTSATHVPTPNKIGNITLVPREIPTSKISTATYVKTAMTDVKKKTAIKADSKLSAAKTGIKRGPPPQRVNIPVSNDYVGAVIKKIEGKVIKNMKTNVKQPIKMESMNATTKEANTSRNTDAGQDTNVKTGDRKRGRENDEQGSQAKRIKKPAVTSLSVTTRSKVQERNAGPGGAVAAKRDDTKQENSDKVSGAARRMNSTEGEGGEEGASSESEDGSLDDYLDSSDASSEEMRELMGRTAGHAQNGAQRSRIVSRRTTSGDEDTDEMFDSLSSSEDEDHHAEYDFTLDLRGERASEFLPLLGRDAATLLTLQKSRLVATLGELQQERAAVRARLRDSAHEARRLRARLIELEARAAADA